MAGLMDRQRMDRPKKRIKRDRKNKKRTKERQFDRQLKPEKEKRMNK